MIKSKSMGAVSGAVALAGAVALLSGAPMNAAQAGSNVECYGISAAGHNDCANKAAGHACAGLSKTSYSGGDFKAVKSKQACMDQHGKLQAFEGKNPAYVNKSS